MKLRLILLFVFVFSLSLNAMDTHTPLCMENEDVIISFKTDTMKIMSICVSKDEKYIVYRYGTKGKIELEYPYDKINSWKCFKYSYYFRGGGANNEGLDLVYLSFTNGGYTYTIYEEYSAVADKTSYGIRIEKGKSKNDIVVNPVNVIGTLNRVKEYEKIEKEQL